MADLIPIVESPAGLQKWQVSVDIPSANLQQVLFSVTGGLFDTIQGNTVELWIDPDANGMYTFGMMAAVSVAESTTQPVVVYREDGGLKILVPSASRVFTAPQVKQLDYRLLTKGFDAMPLGASLNPTYNGLVLGGGVRIPAASALQTSGVVAFNTLSSAPFDSTAPISFVYDRQGKTFYWISTTTPLANTKVYGAIYDADLAGYKVSYNAQGQRTVILFHASGLVETFDPFMFKTASKDLGYKVHRVVCRRAGVGAFTVDSYVAFDIDGRAHYLSAALVETSVKSDAYYVNGSDSYDVLSTLDGALVGSNLSAAAGIFWYQFVPSSFLAMGYDPATSNICQFNIRDNKLYSASRALMSNDCVVFNSTAAWTETGGKLVAGMDTNGTDALFSFADAETPTQTKANWPYIELLTPPYSLADSYDRLFFYAARPVRNLKHMAIRNYQVTMPDLSKVALGPTVKFSFTVDAADPDLNMPITAPEGVTVALQLITRTVDDKNVETVTKTPVTKAYDGQEIEVTLSHAYITSSSFPISIGRSVYQFEMKTDDLPDAFSWNNILGVQNDTWNRTEDITITGINVSVPVTVLIDGQNVPERVKIYVNGVEKQQPVYMLNGQTLGFEIQHKNNTTNVIVNVGTGRSTFGAYTIVEAHLDVGRHWAYMPIGKEVRSDTMKNTGTIPLTLTITETDAQFSQGGQTVTIPVNGTTSILFTPSENKQNVVKFHSDQYSYEWNVWSDNHWLGAVPPTKRAERYVMGESDDILFGSAIPDNFWTYLKVPAGMLLDIDGVRVVLPLDSRGVYREQDHVLGPFECADTILKIHGLPSHQQPHTVMLGNAPLPWLYDFTTDPVYAPYATDHVSMIDVGYDARKASFVSAVTVPTYVVRNTDKVILVPVTTISNNGTQATTFVDTTAMTPVRKPAQVVDLPHLDAYGRDFVDNFASFKVQSGLNVTATRFDLFTHTAGKDVVAKFIDLPSKILGQKDYIEVKPLFSFFGSDKSSTPSMFDLFQSITGNAQTTTTYPLFESITGSSEKITTYPLFEMLLGDQYLYDSFWPTFYTDLATKSDTFSNQFVPHLLDEPQHFDSFKPRWNDKAHAVVPKIEARSAAVGSLISVANSLVRKIMSAEAHAIDLPEAQKVESTANFPQPMSSAILANSPITAYHIGMNAPLWQRSGKVYSIDTHIARFTVKNYYNAELSPWEIPFVRWHKSDKYYSMVPSDAVRMEHPIHYDIDPAPSAFSNFKVIADHVAPQSPTYTASSPVYSVDSARQVHLQDRPADSVTSAPNKQVAAPRSIPVAARTSKTTPRSTLRVEIIKPRASKTSVYGVTPPVIETWFAPVDYGETDQLKEGYFATELAALQNATQVWGFDPSMVFAIQQPSGVWTWAQVTVCEETCGSMSCSARGYMSGG